MGARTCFADLGATWQVAPAASVTARLAYDDFEVRDAIACDPPSAGVGVARDLGTDRWVSGEAREAVPGGRSVGLVVRGAKAALLRSIMHAQAEGAGCDGPLLRQAEVLEYPTP